MTLHSWSTNEQIAQLQQYFLQNTPSSCSNLGFLMNNDSNNVDIWVSHEDPINTRDIVVWIFDYREGIRVFVNTEFILDNSEVTSEAIDHVFSEDRKNTNIRYFKSSQDEALFRQSLQVLESTIGDFITKKKLEEPIFGDVNLLWLSVFYKYFKLSLDLPHCRLAKQSSLQSTTVNIPDHLELSTIETHQDILTVQSNNKYVFSYDYIKDCSRLSSAIRRKDNKELVAWTMTHPDFSIGALYVMPGYRRQRLAEAVITNISKVYADYYRDQLPNAPLPQLYFNVFIERTNTPSLSLFKKSGFKLVSVGVSRIQISGTV